MSFRPAFSIISPLFMALRKEFNSFIPIEYPGTEKDGIMAWV